MLSELLLRHAITGLLQNKFCNDVDGINQFESDE